jgi:hypothetical protein
MPASERLAELAAILAAGVIRLYAQKSSRESPETGEFSLDFNGRQSGCDGQS